MVIVLWLIWVYCVLDFLARVVSWPADRLDRVLLVLRGLALLMVLLMMLRDWWA